MPAARGVKRSASQRKPKETAGSSKIKKKVQHVVEKPTVATKLGEVFTCGQGDVGQLGHGEDSLEIKRFAQVKCLPSNIVVICAGGMHTVLLDKNGKIWTFGCNDEGALGRETSGEGAELTPGAVTLPGKAIKISAGDSHTAALLESGQVFAWGSFRDSHGNMGLTLKGNERIPVEMLPGHNIISIASGADHLVMLSDQGQIFTCGCGEQGQLGRVTARSCDRNSRLGLNGLLVPAPLILSKDKSEFDAIWAGTYTTFARRAGKGDILVWGLNNYQQIGVRKGKPGTVFVPVVSEAFAAVENVVWDKITSGLHHTLALDTEGVCYALGRCEYGRLGLGEGCTDASDLIPIPALKDKKCVEISCGPVASFAVLNNGEVYAWGMGSTQLGTGSENDVNEPALLRSKQLEGRSAISVSGGGQHTVLLVATIKDMEDTVDDAEPAGTAPNVKVDTDAKLAEEKIEDQPAEDKPEEDSPMAEVKAPEEKPTRTASKRGRKASANSTTDAPTKKVNTKQNGGLSPPQEAEEKPVEATPMEVDSTESAESVKGTQEQKEVESQEEKQPEKESESIEEEPSCKRIKLDIATEKPENNTTDNNHSKDAVAENQGNGATPAAVPEKVECDTPEEKKEESKAKTEIEECPAANLNGSVEPTEPLKEVQDVEMKSSEAELIEKKIEAQSTTENNSAEVNAS